MFAPTSPIAYIVRYPTIRLQIVFNFSTKLSRHLVGAVLHGRVGRSLPKTIPAVSDPSSSMKPQSGDHDNANYAFELANSQTLASSSASAACTVTESLDSRMSRLEKQLQELMIFIQSLKPLSPGNAPPTPSSQLGPSPPYSHTPLPLSVASASTEASTSYLGSIHTNVASSGFRFILEYFPKVETNHIHSIVRHESRPLDLHKLNPRLKHVKREITVTILDGCITISLEDSSSLMDYPTSHSLILPLLTYVGILTAAASGPEQALTISLAFNRYLAILTRFTAEFQWSAVLAYHMEFHMHHRIDMREGFYGQDRSGTVLPSSFRPFSYPNLTFRGLDKECFRLGLVLQSKLLSGFV